MLKLKSLGSGSKNLSRQARQDENKPARSVQRWCPCHHHHGYGAGNESTACYRTGGVETCATGVFELRIELHLPRHLLEQSSSSVPSRQTGQREHPLGEPAPTLLALAFPLHHGLDGREPPRRNADCYLWLRTADGGDCLLYSATRHHRQRRPQIASRAGHWQRLEGQTLSRALPPR